MSRWRRRRPQNQRTQTPWPLAQLSRVEVGVEEGAGGDLVVRVLFDGGLWVGGQVGGWVGGGGCTSACEEPPRHTARNDSIGLLVRARLLFHQALAPAVQETHLVTRRR